MEHTNVAWPVWPDAQEVRMLRALVHEGVAHVAAGRHGLDAFQFHGWRIWVWRHYGAPQDSMHIDIRSRDGDVWARFAWADVRHADDELV